MFFKTSLTGRFSHRGRIFHWVVALYKTVLRIAQVLGAGTTTWPCVSCLVLWPCLSLICEIFERKLFGLARLQMLREKKTRKLLKNLSLTFSQERASFMPLTLALNEKWRATCAALYSTSWRLYKSLLVTLDQTTEQ